MKFEDINTNELRKMQLYPISHFNDLKIWVSIGYADKFHTRRSDSMIYPSRFGGKNIVYKPNVDNKENIFTGRMSINSFEEIKKEEFEWLGFGGKSLAKLLWLQKYLKGEESGTFTEKDGIYQNILFQKALVEKDEQIRSLKEQLEKIRIRNTKLIEENNSLKEIMKETEKTRKKIEKAKIQFMEIFENI